MAIDPQVLQHAWHKAVVEMADKLRKGTTLSKTEAFRKARKKFASLSAQERREKIKAQVEKIEGRKQYGSRDETRTGA